MDKKIKIAYVEDLRIVREAVNFLLSHQEDLEIIHEEPEQEKIPEFIGQYRPDIIILDLQLASPDEKETPNGFLICEKIAELYPDVKIIAHSMYDTVEHVNKFFQRGGHAFVSKKAGHMELIGAIKAVSEGHKFICSQVAKQVKNEERFLKGEDEFLKAIKEIFTKTEKNILERISKGYSTKQIAHQLGISEKTVETHRKHLFDKAGVKNVAELIAFVFSRRIVME